MAMLFQLGLTDYSTLQTNTQITCTDSVVLRRHRGVTVLENEFY